MKAIGIDELKKIQIEMMQEFHDFCKANDIQYFLTGGSLLGAIRHRGYIPWDDDIDVVLPRPDYQHLLEIFNQEHENTNLKIFNIDVDPQYYTQYAKLMNMDTVLEEQVDSDRQISVFIDVFPLDNMSDDYDKAKHLFIKTRLYRNLLNLKNLTFRKDRSLYKNIILLLGKFFLWPISRKSIICSIDKISRIYERPELTNYVCINVTGTYGIKEILKGEWFSATEEVEFEGRKFYAPKNYDKVLSHFYGDYMNLPPEEKRVTHHAFKAYWK